MDDDRAESLNYFRTEPAQQFASPVYGKNPRLLVIEDEDSQKVRV